MASNDLTISNISASGLGKSSPDEDVSKHNPYVVFELGSEEFKTKSEKKAGSEVAWEGETIALKTKSGDVLTVSVIHKRHLLSDTVIGKGTITLAELGENGPAEIKLTEPKSGSNAGILTIHISGNINRDYPKTATIKGTTGDKPAASGVAGSSSGTAGFAGLGAEAHNEAGVQTGRAFPKEGDSSSLATAGFAGSGAEAHDEAGVKTGRAFPKDTESSSLATGGEAAAITAGAAGAASAGASAGAGVTGPATGASQPAAAATSGSSTTGSTQQTYLETAKAKAAGAAEFANQKLQDLKIGLVGEDGVAKAEGKTAVTNTGAGAPATYTDRAKEGAAYLITKTQDALEYTAGVQHPTSTQATSKPISESGSASGAGPASATS